MSNTSATKYVEITSSIKNPLILTVEGESEGRVIADAAEGVVLTYNDMAKIGVSNSSYALKLEDNKICLLYTSSRQNLCEELFLKIQNKFLGGFLIMEAINNVQNKTRFTPKFIASVGILSGISIVPVSYTHLKISCKRFYPFIFIYTNDRHQTF